MKGMAGGMQPGLTRLAAALGGAGRMEQQGFDAESANQSRMQQALAAAQKAALEQQQADEARAASAARQGFLLDTVALRTGQSRPVVDAYLDSVRTGQPPGRENPQLQGPPELGRNAPMSPVPIDEPTRTRLGQELSRFVPLMGNTSEMDPSKWATVLEAFRRESTRDGLYGDVPTFASVGQSEASIAGRPTMQIPNDYTGNPFTGEVNMQQPINAGRQAYVGAQTAAQQANSRQSDASASASRALAAERNRPPTAPVATPPKPLPGTALKMQQEAVDAIGISSSINADLSALEQQITDGKLTFGPVSNLMNQGRNMAGRSNEQSRNFATFKSSLERLRNESLRLNTGVQTDGDAQRAWNELFQNITDTELVKQRLQEIKAINARGVELQQLKIDGVRANYGAEPLDTSGARQVQPALNGGGPAVGAVVDGYRFKGGDPGKPTSWEKVR